MQAQVVSQQPQIDVFKGSKGLPQLEYVLRGGGFIFAERCWREYGGDRYCVRVHPRGGSTNCSEDWRLMSALWGAQVPLEEPVCPELHQIGRNVENVLQKIGCPIIHVWYERYHYCVRPVSGDQTAPKKRYVVGRTLTDALAHLR